MEVVPAGWIPHPLTIYRKADSSRPAGKANYGGREDTPRAFEHDHELIEARALCGQAMVLWADCQVDKFKNQGKPSDKWYAGIAPILPARKITSSLARSRMLEGRKKAFFPLFAFPEAGIPEDSYVDLRQIWSVSQSILTARRATLSVRARDALYEHLFLFLTDRAIADTVHCPRCAATIPARDLIPRTEPGDDGE